MSLLQEYQWHRNILGRLKLEAIDHYLSIFSRLDYSDIIYKEEEFYRFDEWYKKCYLAACYNRSMEEVEKAVINFTKERDWDQFHSPENLAKSISIEAGELLECFQWNSSYDKQEVCDELADVSNYCILLADKLGVRLEDIVMDKIKKTAEKYPVEKAKGKSTKYTKL